VMFFWKLSHDRLFLLRQTRGIFWKLPGRGALDVLLELERCSLERTRGVGKGSR